jgi:putative transcriptional regulator
MTDKNYKSEAFEAIHSSAKALYKIKAIDKQTMRNFDDACLMKNEQTSKPLED